MLLIILLFHHDGDRYHIETSPLICGAETSPLICGAETRQLICGANQWTGFYMITPSVMKELNVLDAQLLLFLSFKHSSCVFWTFFS